VSIAPRSDALDVDVNTDEAVVVASTVVEVDEAIVVDVVSGV